MKDNVDSYVTEDGRTIGGVLMEMKNITLRFGGVVAIQDISFDIREGEIRAIIGPNGAGKSTLLNCFVGRLIPDTGSVMFDGTSLIGLKPHEINQAGVTRVFQTPEIFGELTLLENGPAAARFSNVLEVDIAKGAEFHHVRAQGHDHERQGVVCLFAPISHDGFNGQPGGRGHLASFVVQGCVLEDQQRVEQQIRKRIHQLPVAPRDSHWPRIR